MSRSQLMGLYGILMLDFNVLYNLDNYGGIYLIFSGISIELYVLWCYKDVLLGNYIKKLVYGILLVCIILVNESLNCNRMMSVYIFPYHIFVEFTGMYIFITLIKCMLELEKLSNQ